MIRHRKEQRSVASPLVDVNKRPSYLEISVHQPATTSFDEQICRDLDAEFSIMEDSEPIKTYLRIRPHRKRDEDEYEFLEIKDDRTVITNSIPPGLKGKKDMKKIEFKFSKVLDSSCSQQDVFEYSISPLVDRFENGENCLIFSYGATNSGKTYTMRGSAKNYGIIPRTLYHIFTRFQEKIHKKGDIQPFRHESTRALQGDEQRIVLEMKKMLISAANETTEMKQRLSLSHSDTSSHCASIQYIDGMPINDENHRPLDGSNLYGLWISFVELYNEKCFDLLAGNGKRTEVKLMTENGGYAYFKDVTELPVFSEEEAFALYVAGYKKLEMAATKANDDSSRSHCFFTIRVVELGVTETSVYPIKVHRMTFCDLAGCERVSQTENTGGLFRQSVNINQSLLSLLKVIRSIRDKQTSRYSGQSFLEKISFRDSKLTRIFQGYFTTSTHIAMMVNVNPTLKMAESSMQTLQSSAIASNVIAFRPKPPPTIVIENRRNNTSFLHSSLDLEDVLEETEEEISSFETNTEIMDSQRNKTPNRVLRHVNETSTVKRRVDIVQNISDHNRTDDKENNNTASTIDNQDLLIIKLREALKIRDDELKMRDEEIKELTSKLKTIEAETREQMTKMYCHQVNKSSLLHINHIELKQKDLERSEKRQNINRKRLFPNTTDAETQTS